MVEAFQKGYQDLAEGMVVPLSALQLDKNQDEKNSLWRVVIMKHKANKKEERENKTKDEYEKKRQIIQKEKNSLFDSKLKKEKQILEKKEQIYKMREEIQTKLRIGSDNLIKKKNDDLNKMKQLRQEFNQIVETKKQEVAHRKHEIAKIIKEEKHEAQERKTRDEVIDHLFIFKNRLRGNFR